jgi:hypothetical protein
MAQPFCQENLTVKNRFFVPTVILKFLAHLHPWSKFFVIAISAILCRYIVLLSNASDFLYNTVKPTFHMMLYQNTMLVDGRCSI